MPLAPRGADLRDLLFRLCHEARAIALVLVELVEDVPVQVSHPYAKTRHDRRRPPLQLAASLAALEDRWRAFPHSPYVPVTLTRLDRPAALAAPVRLPGRPRLHAERLRRLVIAFATHRPWPSPWLV